MENENNFDFVGFGDIVVDTFIKLSVGHIEETAKGAEYCIPYGAKIPYDSVTIVPAVGNSSNAVVSASRLGLKSAFITSVGNDANGKICLEKLENEKVALDFVQKQEGKETNHYYIFWYGNDRTIFVKHEEFIPVMPDIGKPKWLYFSSLGRHTLEFHKEISKYLELNPEIKLAFQPGTFQFEFGKKIDYIYKRSDVVCMNKEEAQGLLKTDEHDMKKLLSRLEEWGSKITIITDGPNGVYMKYNNDFFSLPIYPDIAPPLERTGAGDAFFSTFISYLAKGFDAKEALLRAPINSMSVVQHIGAHIGLLNEEEIEEYLRNAPENYKLKII